MRVNGAPHWLTLVVVGGVVPGVWGSGGVVRTLGGTRGMGPGPWFGCFTMFCRIWPCFGCVFAVFGLIWPCFPVFGHIWPCFPGFLAIFGPVWPYLALYWPYLAQYWPYLAQFGPVLAQYWPSGGQSERSRWCPSESSVVPD